MTPNDTKQFEPLLNKPVEFMYGDDVMNTFQITVIKSTFRLCPQAERGVLFYCPVTWEKPAPVPNEPNYMEFDLVTLMELLKFGKSVNLSFPGIWFRLKPQNVYTK